MYFYIFFLICKFFFLDKTLNVASASPTGSQSNETSVENTKSVIAPRILDRVPPFMIPRQVWLENFNTMETNRIGIVDLHPEVFGARPKLHLIYENLKWQVKYRQVVRIEFQYCDHCLFSH